MSVDYPLYNSYYNLLDLLCYPPPRGLRRRVADGCGEDLGVLGQVEGPDRHVDLRRGTSREAAR